MNFMAFSTSKNPIRQNIPAQQKGVALLMSLIILLILTILGLSALTSSTNQEQISSNIQQAKTAFYSAQSGVNGYTNEGNAGNDLTNAAHILALTRAAADPANINSTLAADALERCVAADGSNSANCATAYLQGVFKARTRAWYRGCLGPATECPGFSLGVGATMPGCHRYQVEGTGWVDMDGTAAPDANEETQAVVDQWLSEVALCAP